MLASAALAVTIPAATAPTKAVPVAKSADARPTKVDIPFTKEVLPNGLTVILHEDHALPLVTVDTLVKVGSRHEEG